MLDIQRQRLKHLLANAILELWKKETGSMSSVLIEGTICITACGGKTTVVQVADKFTGVFPQEDEENNNNDLSGDGVRKMSMTPHLRSPKFHYVPQLDWNAKEAAVAVILSGLSPESLVSPSMIPSQSTSGEPLPSPSLVGGSNHKTVAASNTQSLDMSMPSKKRRMISVSSVDSSDEDDADMNDNSPAPVPTTPQESGPVGVTAGFYRSRTPDLSSSGVSSMGTSLGASLSASGVSGLGTSCSRIDTSDAGPSETNKCHLAADCDADDLRRKVPTVRRSESPLRILPPMMTTSTPICNVRPNPLSISLEVSSMMDSKAQDSSSEEDTSDDDDDEDEEVDVVRSAKNSPVKVPHGNANPPPPTEEGDHGNLEAKWHRRNSDLALSPPHSYTAQVRDVIRQRLLANNNNKSSSESSPAETSESEARRPSASGSSATTSVTIDTSGMYPSMPPMATSLGLYHLDEKELRERFPFPIPSGPASWPVAGSDKSSFLQHAISQGDKYILPSHFSAMLPGGPPFGPGTMFPAPPPPGFPRHPLLGAPSLHEMLGMVKHEPLPSPQGINHTPTYNNDDARSLSTQASGRSTPEVTDINGNSEKDVTGEQKVYRCEYCNKTFLFKSKYHEHLPVHTNARPFQCHLCSRTYKYKYDLRVHLRTHMGIPTKSTICPFCSSKFHTNKMLRLHIKESHQDRQRVTEEQCTQQTEHLPPAL